MKILVTGGAGFIGSQLVNSLRSHEVTVIDDLSSGNRDFLPANVRFVEQSLLDLDAELLRDRDFVFHLAAISRVKGYSYNHFECDLRSTYNLLEAMRKHDVSEIAFTSSSTVYGKAPMPTTENSPLEPISVYGASNLACEALISAYSHSYGITSYIFRLANIVGPRGHGVCQDFIDKLRRNPEELEILGDGMQRKSYLYVDDCVDAMLAAIENSGDKVRVNIFNIGSADSITVKQIAEIASETMGVHPVFKFTHSPAWTGDVTRMLLSIEKISKLWKPTYNSKESIEITVREVLRGND